MFKPRGQAPPTCGPGRCGPVPFGDLGQCLHVPAVTTPTATPTPLPSIVLLLRIAAAAAFALQSTSFTARGIGTPQEFAVVS